MRLQNKSGITRNKRPIREVDSVVEYWCFYGKHFVPFNGFYKDKGAKHGIESRCKTCLLSQRRKLSAKPKRPVFIKYCLVCKTEKPSSEFSKNNLSKDGLFWMCKPCHADYNLSTKERRATRAAIYREKNRESLNEYMRHYSAENRQKWLEGKRKSYQKNKSQILPKQRQYAIANAGKIRGYLRQYREEHREQIRVLSRGYKSRRKQAKGGFTFRQWVDKFIYFGERCYLCRCSLTLKAAHIEHRIPLSRGGSNFISNLAPACAKCNLTKNSKTEREFRAWLSQLN